MNDLNSIILEGNAIDNAVFNTTVNVTTFTVAVNRTYKKPNGEVELETSYYDVKYFGETSEIEKGRGVRIVGRLKQERWTDSSGKHCSKVVIIAEHIELKPVFNKGV